MTILVGGQHSGVGKTTLGCRLGQLLQNACAVKCTTIENSDVFQVISDPSLATRHKDCERYLQSGFSRVYWIQCPLPAAHRAAQMIREIGFRYQYTLIEGYAPVLHLDCDMAIYLSDPNPPGNDQTPGSDLQLTAGQYDLQQVLQQVILRQAEKRLTLITGRVDSGKTSWCQRVLVGNAHNPIGGIVLRKAFCRGVFCGYDVARINTATSMPFARRIGNAPPGWDPAEQHGRYSFSREGLAAARSWIRAAASRKEQALLVDEIGPLELTGGGLCHTVSAVLEDPPRHVYLVVRQQLIPDVVRHFSLSKYQVFTVSPPPRKP